MLFSLPFPDKLAAGTYYYNGRRKQLFRIDSGLLFYTTEKGNERLSPGCAYLVADIEPEYKARETSGGGISRVARRWGGIRSGGSAACGVGEVL